MNAADVQYVLDRFDPVHVSGLAAAARRAWEDGVTVELCYQPGDGTHYALVLTPVTWQVIGAPGGGTGGYEPSSGSGVYPRDGRHALVCYLQRGTALIVGEGEFVHPGRVESHLTDNAASALALAVLLNAITGQDDEWTQRHVENATLNEGGQ